MEDAEDYGMELYEVDTTQHIDGRCVDCPHSNESWCTVHKQWAYMIGEFK